MTELAEPGPTSSDAEFDFEWEVAPLGQRETQRPVARNRMVNPGKVSCANSIGQQPSHVLTGARPRTRAQSGMSAGYIEGKVGKRRRLSAPVSRDDYEWED